MAEAPERDELSEAQRRADEALAAARHRQHEVSRVVGSLGRMLEENHFAERLAEALGRAPREGR